MARGSVAKKSIVDKLFKDFEGKIFLAPDGKEIRIREIEDGEEVQIKIGLTCAKENIECGDPVQEDMGPVQTISEAAPASITQEEKNNVKDLMSVLGL